jgi:hypothetical protein
VGGATWLYLFCLLIGNPLKFWPKLTHQWFFVALPLVAVLVLECWARNFPPPPEGERSLRSVLFHYLEQKKPSNIVLVGSSITANIIDEDFEGVTNLGLDGANALTGLKIISESGDLPKLVIVEMGLNTLIQSRGLHQEIYQMFLDRCWTLWRREWLYCTRRENNLHLRLRTWVRNQSTSKNVRGLLASTPSWYQRALGQYVDRQRRREAQHFYESENVKLWLEQKKQLIDCLRQKGVKVILLRSPEAEELRAFRSAEYAMERAMFPPDQYEWIDPQLKGLEVATTDGIHPLREDSIRLLKFFFAEIK